ncbi:flagellar basal body-associated FliL family protein [Undibacterium sp. RuRC25W]|uniref:flagellar basal body-associated FliL family protein n=1 Tax=Undibacterium sp. RuRC25W TaxID=3413047 RepID=UPI003BF17AFA
MPNDQNKNALLSANLDFETVKFTPVNSAPVDFFDLESDSHTRSDLLEAFLPSSSLTGEESVVAEAESISVLKEAEIPLDVIAAPVTVSSAVVDHSGIAPRESNKVSTRKNGQKTDNFALYAALVALCGFVIVFGVIFHVGGIRDNTNTPSYLTLPEQVSNFEGQVIRIKVTVQVDRKDRDWLSDNKIKLMALFPIVLTRINPDDLHSEKGFDAVREKLRAELNQEMRTDKIQSVLMDELLTQTRE